MDPRAFFEPDVIAGNKLIVWNSDRLWHFGYMQSSIFMAWVRAFAGRLKSDFSVSPALVYFPIPFVVPNGAQEKRIDAAVQAILDERERHGAHLDDLYAPTAMPLELRRRHYALDALIDDLYGLRRPTEAGRMKALLRSYEKVRSSNTKT